MAGSIPVRLRYQGFWLPHARDREDRVRFTGLKNRWGCPGTGAAPRNLSRPRGRFLLLRADPIVSTSGDRIKPKADFFSPPGFAAEGAIPSPRQTIA